MLLGVGVAERAVRSPSAGLRRFGLFRYRTPAFVTAPMTDAAGSVEIPRGCRGSVGMDLLMGRAARVGQVPMVIGRPGTAAVPPDGGASRTAPDGRRIPPS